MANSNYHYKYDVGESSSYDAGKGSNNPSRSARASSSAAGGSEQQGEEGEEDAESSSSNTSCGVEAAELCNLGETPPTPGWSSDVKLQCELSSFRELWQEEIKMKAGSSSDGKENKLAANDAGYSEVSKDNRAKVLFLEGIKNERNNKLAEAIYYYRQAVQLDPDVEFKVNDDLGNDSSDVSNDEADAPEADRTCYEVDEQRVQRADKSDEPLIERFHLYYSSGGDDSHQNDMRFCEPEYEQKRCHMGVLPVEMIHDIFRWVVSDELDLRSLEQLSAVCRGFYICARDDELWRMACVRVWGVRCGSPGSKYNNCYRHMYIHRPHLHSNGCYISHTSYIRYGEKGLDNCYKPWFTVHYYRYLRFLPDGTVSMLTSADEPHLTVAKLRHGGGSHVAGRPHAAGHTGSGGGRTSSSVTAGHYQVNGDVVVVIITKHDHAQQQHQKRFYSRHNNNNNNNNNNNDPVETIFHMEFYIKGSGRRKHCQLMWKQYSIVMKYKNGHEVTSEFDLEPSTFPPFYFSRVKSYSAHSAAPLS